MLQKKTCDEILEEVQHFEEWCIKRGLSVHRPNSMNNYGEFFLCPFSLRVPTLFHGRETVFPEFFPSSASKKNLIFLFLGAILDHFGFAGILSTLTDKLNIFCETFFPHIGPLDEHHGFIVEYAKGKDVKLDFHVRIFFSEIIIIILFEKQDRNQFRRNSPEIIFFFLLHNIILLL